MAQAAEVDVEQRLNQAARQSENLQDLQTQLAEERAVTERLQAVLETEHADLKVRCRIILFHFLPQGFEKMILRGDCVDLLSSCLGSCTRQGTGKQMVRLSIPATNVCPMSCTCKCSKMFALCCLGRCSP